ncbi:hypothetical protein M3Y96_00558700 [Aphelenchoides besseyi]|nr:hypothetical protein M3Y96_00558700 [Aphelenchoides besseyi]
MSSGLRFLAAQLMFVELGSSMSTLRIVTSEAFGERGTQRLRTSFLLSNRCVERNRFGFDRGAIVLVFNLILLIIVLLLHRSRCPQNPTDAQLDEADENCEIGEKPTVKKKSRKVDATKKPNGLKVKRKSSSTDTPSEFKFDGNQTKETGTVMLNSAEHKATSSNTNLESPK